MRTITLCLICVLAGAVIHALYDERHSSEIAHCHCAGGMP